MASDKRLEYLPIFVDLTGRPVLVVGGGPVAARKAQLLIRAGARVTVVAPEACGELRIWHRNGRLEWLARRYRPSDLKGVRLAFAATGDTGLHARIRRHADRRGVLVNSADDSGNCDFILPAIVDRSPVIVAVSTGGASPVVARRVRIQIELLLPRSLGALARFLGRTRSRVAERIRNPDARRRFHETLIEGPVARALDAGRLKLAEHRFKQALNGAAETRPGRVTLAGAGPGDPELLTLKALASLQRADVIVHDGLVSEPVLDLARRDARRISVAKRSGDHSAVQSEINALLIDLARAGKEVVRLKGGDPFIFGRGGEEAQALRAAGIDYEIVPGITAAAGCAAYAGLPLTHRDHATGVRLVTAHCKGSRDKLDWRALAAEPQTLAFYMGVASLGRIQSRLLAHGRDPETPVAIVENGTRPEQRVLGGRLAQLKALGDCHCLRSPALVFVGEVAGLALELSWYGSPPLTLSENPLASTAG